MQGTTFNLRDIKELTTAADHVNHLLQHERRARGVPARIEGVSTATGWGTEIEGRVVSVATLFESRDFLVTFLVETPSRLYTVGGVGAKREDVAAERLTLL